MRRIAIIGCLAGLLLGTGAAPAGAATITPTTQNFGSHAVGSVSAPRAFTLAPDVLDVLPLTITTTGDFQQTNNCPAALQFINGPCTISVTFAPRATGNRTGTLSTTTLVLGGPTASLSGTGTAGGNDGKTGQNQVKGCKKKGKKKGGKKRGKRSADAVAAKKKKGKKGKKCKGKKKKGKGKKKK